MRTRTAAGMTALKTQEEIAGIETNAHKEVAAVEAVKETVEAETG